MLFTFAHASPAFVNSTGRLDVNDLRPVIEMQQSEDISQGGYYKTGEEKKSIQIPNHVPIIQSIFPDAKTISASKSETHLLKLPICWACLIRHLRPKFTFLQWKLDGMMQSPPWCLFPWCFCFSDFGLLNYKVCIPKPWAAVLFWLLLGGNHSGKCWDFKRIVGNPWNLSGCFPISNLAPELGHTDVFGFVVCPLPLG